MSLVRWSNRNWRRQWQPTPVLLPGKSHGWRSLIGCSSWDREELDTTERLHFHVSLSCIGEGNGNPLQCSCLVNPRDGGAWWAAIYGVAQSRTQLERLSSSSSSSQQKQDQPLGAAGLRVLLSFDHRQNSSLIHWTFGSTLCMARVQCHHLSNHHHYHQYERIFTQC